MRAAWILCCKDVRQRLRDRTALLVGVVMPLLLSALIGLALGGSGGGFRMRLGVVAPPEDALSAPLGDFLRREWLVPVLEVVPLASGAEAQVAVETQAVDAALVLQAGPAGTGVVVLAQARHPLAARLAGGLARAFARGADRAGAGASRAQLAAAPALRTPPARRLRIADYFVASMAVLFLSFAVLAGVRAFQAEQDTHTLARLAASPASPAAILAGKFGALVVLGLCQMTVVILFSAWVIGTRWGDPLAVAALVATTVLYAVGFTCFVVTATGDAERGRTLATVLIFLLAVVGGQFLPPQGLPDVFDVFARLTPNGQAFRGFSDLAAAGDDGGLSLVAEPLLVTSAVGIAGIAYGARRARRALEGRR